MNKNEFSSSLLELNKDYLNIYSSDAYKIGRSILDVKEMIKNGKFLGAYKILRTNYIGLKIREFSKKRSVIANRSDNSFNGRIAVYTAIFDDYDMLFEPFIIDSRCDYYLISDKEPSPNSVWKEVDNEYVVLTNKMNSIEKNRYYKMHPNIIFPEYEYSIYVDGNIAIFGFVSELISYVNEKTGIALHNMSNRDCIYDERKACALYKKGNVKRIQEQVKKYRKEGFPMHFGIYECPVIVRKNSEECNRLMEEWWGEFVDGGFRDQISFPYVIWKNGYSFEEIGFIGNDVRTNPYFRVNNHKKR